MAGTAGRDRRSGVGGWGGRLGGGWASAVLPPPGALLGVAFAIGVFTAPYFASARLVVPEIVGDDERVVAQVNALLSGANQIAQIAGPVLAGLLIAAAGPSAVLV